jgi:DNA-binding transcriptional LysR family regulator
MIGCEVLPPILATFRRELPGVALELVVSNRAQNLDRNDADIAVRMMWPSQTMLTARRIETHIGLIAHCDYTAKRSRGQRPPYPEEFSTRS